MERNNISRQAAQNKTALPSTVFFICADESFGHTAASLSSDRLIFVRMGELSLTLSCERIQLGDGAIARIPARERIRGGVCGDDGCEFYEIELDSVTYDRIGVCYPCDKSGTNYLFSRLYDAFYNDDTHECEALMSLISSTIERSDESLSHDESVCVEHIRAEADRGTYSDVGELLSALSLERSAERMFAKAYKISLSAYMTQKRLERARSLLCLTKYTIGEISERTGFAESNHFTKFFTYHTSLTPSNFRRRYAGICERDMKKKGEK